VEQSDKRMTPVERREDIPAFTNEEEEHQYWATHEIAGALLAQMAPMNDDFLPPVRPRTRPVPLRLGDDVVTRAKALAARRHTGYQTLLKEFIVERLYEEEKRAGLR
jgi:CopG antitoxin of type II toxin-antitoxin system